ncbi:MAG: hypothetical protein QM747_11120 [Nocardioides sp.]
MSVLSRLGSARRRTPARRIGPRRPQSREATPEVPPNTPLPAPWAAARFDRERQWWERPIAWSAGVGLLAGLVAGVVWVTSGSSPEQKGTLTHATTYEPPVELSPGTAYIRTKVLPSGDLEVTHWIQSTTPVQYLTAKLPAAPGLTAGSLVVSHVVLAADGVRSSAVPVADVPNGVTSYRVPGARVLFLRYRLSGALKPGTDPQHSLALVTSLLVTTGTKLTSTTESVVASHVLSLGCTYDAPSGTPWDCGTTSNGQSVVRLYGTQQQSRVTASLDLS